MWSRSVIQAPSVCVSDSVLPTRGSNHPAFTEMVFLWGDCLPDDPRYRRVVLPHGFRLENDHDGYKIKDLNDFTRALVLLPTGKNEVPSIIPVKRFSLNSVAVDEQFRGSVVDWDVLVYRTPPLKTQKEALDTAKKWLDDNRPKWDSFISQINFDRRP